MIAKRQNSNLVMAKMTLHDNIDNIFKVSSYLDGEDAHFGPFYYGQLSINLPGREQAEFCF